MKEHVYIAIDSGKYATKGLIEYRGKTSSIMFRTKSQEVHDVGIDIQPNSFKIDFENKQYLLGNMVSESQSNFDLSKETMVHKLAIYTAICELMTKEKLYFHNIDLHIAINVPISVYKSKQAKDSFKNFVENNGKPIFFRLNGKVYNFNLINLTICFEGMGLTYTNFDEYAKKTSAVIDIGGLNTTYCTFDGVHPDFNSMTLSHFGINVLKAKIEQELVQRYNRNVSANDLEQIIQRGYMNYMGKVIEESARVISHIKTQHFENIINYAKQHNYTFNQDIVYFVGGGSILLQKEIKELFPQAIIVVNPQFANVKSFLEILKVKYQ